MFRYYLAILPASFCCVLSQGTNGNCIFGCAKKKPSDSVSGTDMVNTVNLGLVDQPRDSMDYETLNLAQKAEGQKMDELAKSLAGAQSRIQKLENDHQWELDLLSSRVNGLERSLTMSRTRYHSLKKAQSDFTARLGLIPKLLYCGVGMKSGEIPDGAITASSSNSFKFAAKYGRLDERVQWQSPYIRTIGGAWCAQSVNSEQWIQVYLGSNMSLSGVVTQGRPKNQWQNENWVKHFTVSCGDTVHSLQTITEGGLDKVFTGNTDKETKMFNKFPTPITCRYLRLHPVNWNENSPRIAICMRLEILRGDCFDFF